MRADALTPAGLVELLREYYPHGHPAFIPNMVEKMELHSRKNSDYAHGGPPLGNFERVGAILALYPNLDHSDPKIVAIDYMLKQLDACLWYWSMWRINGHTLSESIEKRWADVVVYSAIVEAMI